MKVAFKAVAATLTDEVLQPDTAAPGQLCPWLEDRGCSWLAEVFTAAAGAGQWAMCEWLLACDCPFSSEAVHAAARGGHLRLVQWFLMQIPGLLDLHAPRLLEGIAEGCDLGDLQRLYGEWTHGLQLHERSKGNILAAAACSPKSDWRAKVEWLEALPGFSRTCSKPGARAAATKDPDSRSRLTWLRGRGYPMSWWAATSAAEADNTAALEYLLAEGGLPIDEEKVRFVVHEAADGGHLAALQALHARDLLAPHVPLALESALSGGHREAASWLLETFPVPAADLQQLMEAAVQSGSLELVRWMVGRGCRVDEDEDHLVTMAIDSGCGELLEWLMVEQGCPAAAAGRSYLKALVNHDMAMLRLLHRLDVPMEAGDDIYKEAVDEEGCLAALRCLWEQLHYPWSPSEGTFNQWVATGVPLAALQWLADEVGCPVDWQKAMKAAEYLSQLNRKRAAEIQQWIHVREAASAAAAAAPAPAGGT